MTIKEFAIKHGIRIKTDEEGEAIVLAKHGQIYDYGSGQFGVMFILKSSRLWNSRSQECEKAGMRVRQDGDTEGALLFDPQNPAQAKTAIRLVCARQKRRISPEQAKAGAERLARFREAQKLDSDLSRKDGFWP